MASDGVYLREIFLTSSSLSFSGREFQNFTACPGRRLFCLFLLIIRLVNFRKFIKLYFQYNIQLYILLFRIENLVFYTQNNDKITMSILRTIIIM